MGERKVGGNRGQRESAFLYCYEGQRLPSKWSSLIPMKRGGLLSNWGRF